MHRACAVHAVLSLLALAHCAGPQTSDTGAGDGPAIVDAGPRDASVDTVVIGADTLASDAASDMPPPSDAADVADVTTSSTSAVLYPGDRSHSPITESVAMNLRAIVTRGSGLQSDVFAKAGASNTVNTNFMQCYAGTNVDLAGRTGLQPTLDRFRGGNAAGTNPYQRTTLAATVGWSAFAALAGDPHPLAQEVAAVHPQFALVMFGTNDIQSRNITRYADNMLDIVDWCATRGIIPILTAVPPRDDDAAADLWVPRYNAVSRAMAQARQTPFIDLERDLRPLANHGLGGDGIHLNAYLVGGASRACVLTAAGLRFGHNVRNLLTLESLARATTAALSPAMPAPDASGPVLSGAGRASDPFVIQTLPFSDVRNTATAGERLIARYTGCATATQDESGAEFIYRFTASRRMRIRAMVFDRGTVDVDLHLLGATPEASACQARDDQLIAMEVAPGTYHFALDTFVSAGLARAGEYVFVLIEDP